MPPVCIPPPAATTPTIPFAHQRCHDWVPQILQRGTTFSRLLEMASPIVRFLCVLAVTLLLSQGLAYLCGPGTHTLHVLAAVAVGIQWVVFLHASGLLFSNERTERYYDITGSFTFATLIALSLSSAPDQLAPRKLLLSLAVLTWCARLGSFLFMRINKHGGIDSRFTTIKPSLLRFLGAWTLQGLWVFVTSLPVLAANASPHSPPLGMQDTVGLAVYTLGLSIEVLADTQKTAFHADPANKNKFISLGLWSLSRHPNYFGEIMLWTGISISAASAFHTAGMWASLLSPVFVAALLIFVSGIPLLERAADKRWGDDPEYKAYKARTPVLIPFVGRVGDAAF
eukprot:m.222944 g.222944  ORF g.222944 m.222944 type:complete len:341 (-) comp10852_c0_seq1:146-1168(-)